MQRTSENDTFTWDLSFVLNIFKPVSSSTKVTIHTKKQVIMNKNQQKQEITKKVPLRPHI